MLDKMLCTHPLPLFFVGYIRFQVQFCLHKGVWFVKALNPPRQPKLPLSHKRDIQGKGQTTLHTPTTHKHPHIITSKRAARERQRQKAPSIGPKQPLHCLRQLQLKTTHSPRPSRQERENCANSLCQFSDPPHTPPPLGKLARPTYLL